MAVRSCGVLLAVFIGCSACGQPNQPAGNGFTLVEEGGITVAHNAATPQFGGELFTYETVVELRPDPAVAESFLYDPYFLAMDDAGRVYVAEQGNVRVSVWDLTGNYLRSIGKKGEGPGELPFGPVYGLEVNDGILSVPMLQNGRTIRFRSDGSYQDTLSVTAVPRAISIHQAAGGELVAIDQPGEDAIGARATVVGEDGEVVATLQTPAVRITHYSGGPRAVFVPPDMILMTTGEEPVIRFHGFDGAVRREIRIDLPVAPVTAAERAAVTDYIDERIAGAPESRREPGGESGTKEQWRRRRAGVTFADIKGYWMYVLVSDSGWLWLLKSRPEKLDDTTNESIEAYVVNPAGRYVGNTTLPPLFTPTAVRGDYLLALVNDVQSGERVPTVFRAVPAVSGLAFPGS